MNTIAQTILDTPDELKFSGVITKMDPPHINEFTGEKVLFMTVQREIAPQKRQYFSCAITGDLADEVFEDFDCGDRVRIVSQSWENVSWTQKGSIRITTNVIPDQILPLQNY